ncbi:hypothetical protein C2S53_018734 [Perilla frutescens var. hirtella]|uniref:Growth-regulating factor n=1 Tax=Perilla frutescens var. hirtella TaxID=608512 RepID=A0AAD4J1J9_PERFH|nr:hypothetical protein C2S53_018734 [Perilla frutescens var. hirtella]
MDFNLKQWRDESEEEEQETSASSAKLPRLNPSSPALPLFVPQPTTTTTHLHYSSSDHSKLPTRMGSYFSLAQWQELELQALIFRHIIAGAAVPPELLHLVKKSLISSPPYYFCNPLHYYNPSLMQSGYWSKAAMDPEPGRCRRTDGKKWRCSRDVVAGQKYCERHMHRGRNRSRKPVEIPTPAAAYGGNGGGSGTPRFSLSTSMDLQSGRSNSWTFEPQSGGDPTLRHFFDDWPRSLHQSDNSATNLSISLKLGTSNGDHESSAAQAPTDRPQLSWGGTMPWETSRVPPMGGPLAEALRSSSLTTSSPTSVLHRLQRSSASETSYVSS